MATVSSKARLDRTFLAVVGGLADTSGTCGTAATGQGARVWQLPPLGGWTGDPSDLGGMVQAFDRSDANSVYESAVSNPASPGTVGDLLVSKTQIDYTAILERGFRARMASPVRCLVHASARRIGHGDPAGVFKSGVIGYVQDAILAAAASTA